MKNSAFFFLSFFFAQNINFRYMFAETVLTHIHKPIFTGQSRKIGIPLITPENYCNDLSGYSLMSEHAQEKCFQVKPFIHISLRFSWVVIFEALLDTSPIKWRQHPNMTVTVDWDVKHQFKQTNIPKSDSQNYSAICRVQILWFFSGIATLLG